MHCALCGSDAMHGGGVCPVPGGRQVASSCISVLQGLGAAWHGIGRSIRLVCGDQSAALTAALHASQHPMLPSWASCQSSHRCPWYPPSQVCTMSALPPHPNVVKLVGVCTAPPHLALVTEFCARGSLYGLLHSPTTYLTWSQIIYMCLGAARGMAHLHRCRVLHRDLKSGNLLVDKDLTVKVGAEGGELGGWVAGWVRVWGGGCKAQRGCASSATRPGEPSIPARSQLHPVLLCFP
jgi:hypothetical protein